MKSWNVYLENEFGNDEHIDTVFYDSDCTVDYVRRGLIEHDGYDPRIEVRED